MFSSAARAADSGKRLPGVIPNHTRHGQQATYRRSTSGAETPRLLKFDSALWAELPTRIHNYTSCKRASDDVITGIGWRYSNGFHLHSPSPHLRGRIQPVVSVPNRATQPQCVRVHLRRICRHIHQELSRSWLNGVGLSAGDEHCRAKVPDTCPIDGHNANHGRRRNGLYNTLIAYRSVRQRDDLRQLSLVPRLPLSPWTRRPR